MVISAPLVIARTLSPLQQIIRTTATRNYYFRGLQTLGYNNNAQEAGGVSEKETRAMHDDRRSSSIISAVPDVEKNTTTTVVNNINNMEVDGSHVSFRSDGGMTTFLFVNRKKKI